MINNKKGAIELSITTIVVVVIGITLLALGLAWVSGIFEKLRGTTASAFEKVDAEVSEILGGSGVTRPLTVSPSRITLNKGKVNTAKITIANIVPGALTFDDAYVAVTSQATGNVAGASATNKVFCEFADGYISGSTPDRTRTDIYDVASNIQYSILVYIREVNAPVGVYQCNFVLNGAKDIPTGWPPEILTVDVTR